MKRDTDTVLKLIDLLLQGDCRITNHAENSWLCAEIIDNMVTYSVYKRSRGKRYSTLLYKGGDILDALGYLNDNN